jgi:hypothetical protein
MSSSDGTRTFFVGSAGRSTCSHGFAVTSCSFFRYLFHSPLSRRMAFSTVFASRLYFVAVDLFDVL